MVAGKGAFADWHRALGVPVVPASSGAAAPTSRFDGWYSALTGLGMASKDKRQSTEFAPRVLTAIEARDLWRGSDIAARVVETIPREMFRQGFDVNVGEDKELSGAIGAAFEVLRAGDALRRAKEFERGYGGAAIWPVINDGSEDLSQPLNEDRIPEITRLKVLEARELTPSTYYDDPFHEKFGEPETYQLVPLSPHVGSPVITIHESRLIIFEGLRVSRDISVGTLTGWGDSVLSRMADILRDFETAWGSAGVLVADFSQAVWKLKNLAEILASDFDGRFMRRMQALELSRAVTGAVLIDGDETFERQTTNITGLPDLLDRFATRLAAACDMPLTLLMGQSPGGLNATGESDIRFFYDRVKSAQDACRPQIERLVYLLLRSKAGPTRGIEPEDWSIEFRPLWQPSDKERADARLTQATTDQIYINTMVLSPEEVARARFGGGDYSFETQVDLAARAKLEPEITAAQIEQVGQLIRAGFDPAAALAALQLPDIEHGGLEPVTVSQQVDESGNPVAAAGGGFGGGFPGGASDDGAEDDGKSTLDPDDDEPAEGE